jgi:sterol desaturase/sphingolipid hydroxylase (fatty acid hydroxylase superfamily)
VFASRWWDKLLGGAPEKYSQETTRVVTEGVPSSSIYNRE